MGRIVRHTELDVFRLSFDTAMAVFELSKSLPREELYSLTDQVRRSSRSVSSNITEAWRKRRYEAAFVAKLNDAETEAAETQTWLQFAVSCKYVASEHAHHLEREYDKVIGMLVEMIRNPDPWLI